MEAPPQQLFKKVEVLREEELSTIQGLLEEALERRLQVRDRRRSLALSRVFSAGRLLSNPPLACAQDAGNAELTQEDREWQHAAAVSPASLLTCPCRRNAAGHALLCAKCTCSAVRLICNASDRCLDASLPASLL